jgi:hypothetical protein
MPLTSRQTLERWNVFAGCWFALPDIVMAVLAVVISRIDRQSEQFPFRESVGNGLRNDAEVAKCFTSTQKLSVWTENYALNVVNLILRDGNSPLLQPGSNQSG